MDDACDFYMLANLAFQKAPCLNNSFFWSKPLDHVIFWKLTKPTTTMKKNTLEAKKKKRSRDDVTMNSSM